MTVTKTAHQSLQDFRRFHLGPAVAVAVAAAEVGAGLAAGVGAARGRAVVAPEAVVAVPGAGDSDLVGTSLDLVSVKGLAGEVVDLGGVNDGELAIARLGPLACGGGGGEDREDGGDESKLHVDGGVGWIGGFVGDF